MGDHEGILEIGSRQNFREGQHCRIEMGGRELGASLGFGGQTGRGAGTVHKLDHTCVLTSYTLQ